MFTQTVTDTVTSVPGISIGIGMNTQYQSNLTAIRTLPSLPVSLCLINLNPMLLKNCKIFWKRDGTISILVNLKTYVYFIRFNTIKKYIIVLFWKTSCYIWLFKYLKIMFEPFPVSVPKYIAKIRGIKNVDCFKMAIVTFFSVLRL